MKNYAVLVMLVLGGCTSMDSVDQDAKGGGGDVREYAVSKGRALEIAKEVFKDFRAMSVEERADSVVASFSTNPITPGSYCGVYPVEKDGKTEVRVVSRRKSQISVFTCLTEDTFHEAFAAKVGK